MDYDDYVPIGESMDYMFPDIPKFLQVPLYNFAMWISEPSLYIYYFNQFIIVFGVLINLFHLIVLTRKKLRTTATNVIMMGLAVSDIFVMSFPLSDLVQLMFYSVSFGPCVRPAGYSEVAILYAMTVFNDFFRRCSPWLVIFMAAVRAIAITKATDSKFEFLQVAKFGWTTILFSIIFSGLIAIVHYFSLYMTIDIMNGDGGYWKPAKSCSGYPKNYTSIRYQLLQDNDRMAYYLQINETTSKLIPCVLFPILSAVLIAQLMKRRKFQIQLMRNGEVKVKKNRTTPLIIAMTVCFMIAELPQGLFKLIPVFVPRSAGFVTMFYGLTDYWNTVEFLNATTHCPLCFILSSQYRSEVRALFCLGKEEGETLFTRTKGNSRNSVTRSS